MSNDQQIPGIPDSMTKVRYLQINGSGDSLMIKEGSRYPLYKTGTLILEETASRELLEMADNPKYLVRVKESDHMGFSREVMKFRVERITKIENISSLVKIPRNPYAPKPAVVTVTKENGQEIVVEQPSLNPLAINVGGLDAAALEVVKQEAKDVLDNKVSGKPMKRNKRRDR